MRLFRHDDLTSDRSGPTKNSRRRDVHGRERNVCFTSKPVVTVLPIKLARIAKRGLVGRLPK